MSRRVSLKDIAEQLGISRTTVSWVLSGLGDERHISKETQDKVIKLAHELNYKPNLLAKALRTGDNKVIGLIVPDIEDQFYSEISKSVECEAYKRGYTITLGTSESQKEKESSLIQLFRNKLIDGLIIAPTKYSQDDINWLLEQQFPLVLFDRYFKELDTDYVITDDEYSGYMLTRHLIEKGCRKIATININKHLDVTQQRIAGYRRALTESGIGVNQDLIADVEFATYRSDVVGALDSIFEKVPDVDGFLFITHIIAIEAITYFSEHGIDYNKDFHMGCVHEVPMMKVVAPKMSIALMPTAEIGRQAVDFLLAGINNRKNGNCSHAQRVKLKTKLIYRD